MTRLFGDAGLADARIVALPPDQRAKGPGLVVATCVKPRSHEVTKKT
jgi:hypothetical protein